MAASTMNVRIGQYELLERFASGGMAEVHFARLRGARGFSRLLAIKRLLPIHSQDASLVSMFLDEARLAAMLLHPNIVQVLDLGELDGEYFIAMELVDGPHLGALYAHGLREGRPLPIPLSVYAVAQAADGVHYAHDRVDPLTGRALAIVHRDMSPHNIIVSRYGDVKVADFGIAHAAIHQVRTEHGVIKGKLGYLAPEQCLGQPVDRRTDVFALGIVLYETLTGRRLYHGGKDMDVMRRIVHEEPLPPSLINPDVDANLGEIALRALRKEPGHRYQSAGQLGDALLAWLQAAQSGDMRSQLGFWVSTYAADVWMPAEQRASKWQAEREAATPPLEPRATAPAAGETFALRERPASLEREPDPFIGRRTELDALADHVKSGARLITLSGPAGVGKSRLARRFVRRVTEPFTEGGTWVCEVGERDSVGGLCVAVGRTLNVTLGGHGEPSEVQLGRALQGRGAVLLVLDDCERLVEPAAGVVQSWLQAAPLLTIIATSRRRLAIPGELVMDVEPLRAPTGDHDISSSPAVHLFVARVRAVRPDYRLASAEAPVVAEIVRQLDGLPLAIELAAARMGVLGARELLERLNERFDVLQAIGGQGDEATLRGAIDWSWESLDEDDRRALARCSLFRGGFSPRSADAVITSAGTTRPPIDLLESLRARSLVRIWQPDDIADEPRLGLLRTVAAYASERLGKRGRMAAEDALVDDLLPRCEAWAAAAAHHGGAVAFLQLARELDNLRMLADALLRRRPLTEALVESALRLVLAAEPVLAARGPAPVLLTTLDNVLSAAAQAGCEPSVASAYALVARAEVLCASGRHGEGRRDAEEALLVAAKRGDDILRGAALTALARAAARQGRDQEALATCEQALDVLRRRGHDRRAGAALDLLAQLTARSGDLERARGLHDRALSTLRRAGDHRAIAWALDHAGLSDMERGDHAAALHHFGLSLDAMNQLGAHRGEGVVQGHLALAHVAGGDLEAARVAAQAGLRALRDAGDREREGRVLGTEADRLLLAARADRAEEPAREALQRAHECGERAVIIRAHLRMVRVLADLGRTREAEIELDHGRGWLGTAASPLRIELALARAHVDAAFAREMIAADHPAAAAAQREKADLQIRQAMHEHPSARGGTALRIAQALWQRAEEASR